MNAAYLLGIDLGTSGVKVVLLPAVNGGGPRTTPRGYPVPRAAPTEEATIGYPLHTPAPGWSEQNPAEWWDAVTRAIGRGVEQSGIRPGDIAGLAVSGQMHGATLLDGAGEVLRPCILWNDQRSGAQCDAITARIGRENLVHWVGNPALAGFTAPKILWVRENEPEVYQRIATVLLPKDYINYRLTGVRATEVSDASGTLLFDVARRQWSRHMLDALEIPSSMLPPVHSSVDVIGTVSVEASRATGLLAGTPVIAGGADNACAAVGMGVVRPGQVLTSLGTSGTVVAPTASPTPDPELRLHMFCHAVPDTWYLMGVVLSAGGSLRWYRDTLAGGGRGRAADPEGTPGGPYRSDPHQGNGNESLDPYDAILDEAATAPPGCEGLVFLPYLTGERTPHGDPRARGAFFGLSLRHTRAHVARSVIEGVTFALADSADLMRELGVDIMSVRATGGGARNAFWRQMQADMLNARVLTTMTDTGPAFGATILAGVGTGVFPSVPEAVDMTQRVPVSIAAEVQPDPETVAIYRRYHRLFDSLYPALKEQFGELAKILSG